MVNCCQEDKCPVCDSPVVIHGRVIKHFTVDYSELKNQIIKKMLNYIIETKDQTKLIKTYDILKILDEVLSNE